MDYNKLEIARQKFQDGQKLCGYSPDTLWLAVIDLFDALLEPPEADGSIDRATDGRITEEPIIKIPAEILADGCDPDPADDGPEVGILRGRVK
jgi:hypothetical protein